MFRVLGPITVGPAHGQLPPKQRTLLAALLIARGRAVSATRLVDELWPSDPPATGATIQPSTRPSACPHRWTASSAVGPGGCGKTRFAVQLARETASDYPDGAHLIELAGLVSASDSTVAVRIAATVGVRDHPHRTTLESLQANLAHQRVLLVLDNCEQVRAACVSVLDRLLPAGPGIRVLATSREPLGLHGEAVYPLEGLGPADAVRLFHERARSGAGRRRRYAHPAAGAGFACRRGPGPQQR